MDPTDTDALILNPELLNQTPLHPELPDKHEAIQGRAGDHNVVWRLMQPVCGQSTSLLERFGTPLHAPHTYNDLCSEGWHWLQAALETTRSEPR